MITDILTLKLISVKLRQFRNLNAESSISNILLESLSNESDVKTSRTFNTLADLDAFIATFPAEPNWDNIQCFQLNLYLLKRFTMTSPNTSTTPVQYEPTTRRFTTTSENVQTAAMDGLNTGKDSYLYKYNEILAVWNELKLDEYIKVQRQYIDCGYIEVYFINTINYLIDLYKKERSQN